MTPNFEINVILSLKLVTNPFPYVRKFTFAILKNSYWNYASISINYENTELILPLSLLSNPTQVLAQQNPPKIWKRILIGVRSEALKWPMMGVKWPLDDRLDLESRVANSTQCWKCTFNEARKDFAEILCTIYIRDFQLNCVIRPTDPNRQQLRFRIQKYAIKTACFI